MLALTRSVKKYIDKTIILQPSSSFPLHGSLLGLYYGISTSEKTERLDNEAVRLILDTCDRVWNLVQGELCIDSPETATEEDELVSLEGPKDLLSYSWRALRDSSLVLQSLLDTQRQDYELYNRIGSLCLEQLIKLRHRGAFSAVAQTFLLCCTKTRSVEDEAFVSLHEAWITKSISEIDKQSNNLTRRSAGLPAIFTALLDPSDPGHFLRIVQNLTQIARTEVTKPENPTEELKLPQVHALNCLREAMLNSRFRAVTETLVVEMLNIAAQCLESATWAIRNCGLMLFQASVARLSPDSSILYGRHAESPIGGQVETPLAVAVHLLRGTQTVPTMLENNVEPSSEQSEIIFAALDLLSHLPYQSDTDSQVNQLISNQYGHRIWAVRARSAELGASRIPVNAIVHTIVETVSSLLSFKSSNQAHGHLLFCRHLLSNLKSSLAADKARDDLTQISVALDRFTVTAFGARMHPIILSVLVDMLNDVCLVLMSTNTASDAVDQWSKNVAGASAMCDQRHGFYLLHRALMLHRCCDYILECMNSARTGGDIHITEGLIRDVVADKNTVDYVVTELLARSLTISSQWLIHLLAHMLSASKSIDIQTIIMLGLSQILSSRSATLTEVEIAALKSRIDLRDATMRDMWNAQIRFAAALSRHIAQTGQTQTKSLLSELVTGLRLSQQDEIEFPTRLHAVKATAQVCIVCFHRHDRDQAVISQVDRIRLLQILYDFLNDDDEEVRQIATAAVSQVLASGQGQQLPISSCGVRAREFLAGLIFSEGGSGQKVMEQACMRVVGLPLPATSDEAKDIESFCQRWPVRLMIEDLFRRATDLFAKEKQNLYVDDVAESDIWTNLTMQNDCGRLDPGVAQALIVWTIEGLEYCSQLLEAWTSREAGVGNDEFIEPSGLTYDAEVLVTFVRAINMAALLRRNTSADMNGRLLAQLFKLQTLCKEQGCHKHVQTALDRALEEHLPEHRVAGSTQPPYRVRVHDLNTP